MQANAARCAAAVVAMLVCSPLPAGADGKSAARHIRPAVVRIFVVSNAPDLESPWQRIGVDRFEGSGVVIDGNRILTNAHVVADHVSVAVKREGMTSRHDARVVHMGHECDLAVLTVDRPGFFDGVDPLELGGLPGLREAVDVYGFPIGGESVSVTSGIVSRVEVGEYAHSRERLLISQIDAAVNEGNSGGPVVAAGKVVGIATQMLDDAENVGYMVPAPVVRHFLDDVADGRFDGFPELGIEWQAVENKALRESLGLARDETGGLVKRVNHGGTLAGVVQPGDVILSIDGVEVAADLTTLLRGTGRVAASYAIQRKQVGDEIEIGIARGAERLTKRVTLRNVPGLVPGPQYDRSPSYLIFGGLVFRPLTVEYIELFDSIPHDMASYYVHRNLRSEQRHQVILLSQVLAGAVNRSYQDLADSIVATVQGEVPRDMADLARIIDDARAPHLTVVTEEGDRLVLDVERARGAGQAILRRYGVRHSRSPDLRPPG